MKYKLSFDQTKQIYNLLLNIKLSYKKAFEIIYSMQKMGIVNNAIEQCGLCKGLYESNREGWNDEDGHYRCDACRTEKDKWG